MIALILPLILNFLGTAGISSLTKILDHKKELLIAAEKARNDAARIELERDIKKLETQIEVKRLQAEMGKVDRQYVFFRLWAYTLVASVMLYWSMRFWVRGLGVDADFGVFVSELSAAEATISTIVVGYVFLKSK